MDGSNITGLTSVQDIREVNSGTVTRDTAGLVSTLVITGFRTMTFTRNALGFVTSMNDGISTWTYTRDANNNITNWAVA